jgi:tRNA (guanine-N7-)-methyltransferase
LDNPTRTTRHFKIMAQREADLKERLNALFEPGDAFVWEVGCGHGHFLVDYAKAHPTRDCIGIDIASERINRATRKRDRAKLSNLHFIQAEARLFLATLPIGLFISDVFILFPDPWPKLRHQKHRIIQPDFLAALARRVTPDCRLHFRTDHEEYFAAATRIITEHPMWQPVTEPWPYEFETVFQSKSATFQSLVARVRS